MVGECPRGLLTANGTSQRLLACPSVEEFNGEMKMPVSLTLVVLIVLLTLR